jgi:hypothetical protein
MWDGFSEDNVDVRWDRVAGAYIMIPPDKIASVEALLEKNDIPFMLEGPGHMRIGAPEAAVIEFGREADIAKIQQVLDSVQ